MMDLESIRAYFERDRFCNQNGIQIVSVTETEAVCTAKIEDRHLNAGDAVQGGMLFTLADYTFAVHANAMGRGTVVSQNANITYVRPARGSVITAKSCPVSFGKTTCLYRSELFDERGALVAYATLNGYVLPEKG